VTLAIFDLDNTLLNGDSDHAWGQFLVTLLPPPMTVFIRTIWLARWIFTNFSNSRWRRWHSIP
jgi:FMN phosphatase YigB (HAD superfamily)